MKTKLDSLIRALAPNGDDALDGQGMVEYALMLVLVVIACIASVTLLGDSVLSLWDIIDDVIGGTLAGA